MPSTALRKQLMKNVRSVVVKVGTALLTDEAGRLDKPLISRIARQLGMLRRQGMSVLGSVGIPDSTF